MTANKNLTDERIKAKAFALMKVVTEGCIEILEARNKEFESHMIPVLSIMAKIQADQRLQAVSQIPSKYFKPDGTIDKRRQRLDRPYGLTYIIKDK